MFWVPAINATTFENAYRDIGRCLGIAGIDEGNADVKVLVKAALSREDIGSWLLIIDNADDIDLFDSVGFSSHLPFSRRGSILFTTRNHQVTVGLDISERETLVTTEMSRAEAFALLRSNLREDQIRDTESTASLLEFLADFPLAIKQASAYMAKVGMTTTKYLGHCRSSNKSLIRLLSKDFEDRGRYKSTKNPLATTWLVSIRAHIPPSPCRKVPAIRELPLRERYPHISFSPSG